MTLEVGMWHSFEDAEDALGDLAVLSAIFDDCDPVEALTAAEGCLFSHVPRWQLFYGEVQA